MCHKCFTIDVCIRERKKHHKVDPCHIFAPFKDKCDDKHHFDPCDVLEKICDCFCHKCKKKKRDHHCCDHHHDHHHHHKRHDHHHDHHRCDCSKCKKKHHYY